MARGSTSAGASPPATHPHAFGVKKPALTLGLHMQHRRGAEEGCAEVREDNPDLRRASGQASRFATTVNDRNAVLVLDAKSQARAHAWATYAGRTLELRQVVPLSLCPFVPLSPCHFVTLPRSCIARADAWATYADRAAWPEYAARPRGRASGLLSDLCVTRVHRWVRTPASHKRCFARTGYDPVTTRTPIQVYI